MIWDRATPPTPAATWQGMGDAAPQDDVPSIDSPPEVQSGSDVPVADRDTVGAVPDLRVDRAKQI